MKISNKKIADSLDEIAHLLEIKGGNQIFRVRAYRKAANAIRESETGDFNAGPSISKKIEELIKTGKIKYLEELKQETAIRQIVTHYFKSKGVELDELKKSSKKREIVYSRYTKPAKQLIELAGNVNKAKKAIDIVAKWANSRDLDYTIETVFKKWPELNRLKPKKEEKKPFYNGHPLIWSESKKKWFVVDETNTWLEFADTEDKIEWKIVKK